MMGTKDGQAGELALASRFSGGFGACFDPLRDPSHGAAATPGASRSAGSETSSGGGHATNGHRLQIASPPELWLRRRFRACRLLIESAGDSQGAANQIQVVTHSTRRLPFSMGLACKSRMMSTCRKVQKARLLATVPIRSETTRVVYVDQYSCAILADMGFAQLDQPQK
jgi:hypothetical protein